MPAASLVKRDDIPERDQPLLSGAQVHEKPCLGRVASRQEMTVGAELLVHEALAGTPRTKLHRIVVSLHEGQETLHTVELATLRVVRVARLIAHGSHEQVQPLVTREPWAGLDVPVYVPGGELDGPDALYEEGAILSLEDEGVVVPQRNLGPDAPHEEAVMSSHVRLVDVDVVEVEVGQPGPVLVVGLHETDRYFVDDLVGRVLLDRGLDYLALVGLHVLRGQGLADELQALLDRLVVGGGTVLAQQELDDKRGHPEGAAHTTQEVLADYQSGEDLRCQPVQLVQFKALFGHAVLTCLFRP